MVKKMYLIICILFAFNLIAEEADLIKQFDRLDLKANPQVEAKIFSITGGVNNISLTNVKIAKPSRQSLKKYGLISRKDSKT